MSFDRFSPALRTLWLLRVVSLNKDVFERRTSTGNGLFTFLDRDFAQIFGQIVSIFGSVKVL